MKKIYFNVLLILVACLNAHAQWVIQTSPVASENRCVFMTSSDVGYIAGAGPDSAGVIMKTINAGAVWDTLSSGIQDTLRSVFFINDSIGYVSGANGTIAKTTDAGLTWTPLTSGVPNLLRSIIFVSDSVGYACGGGGVILRTLDGGNTWVQQTSGTTQDLINIRFIDPDNGYCVSSLGTFLSGIILKTVDGGNNWTSVYTDPNGMLGLAVVGDSIVYAGGGYETIVKSVDAGTTWSVVNPTSASAFHFRSASFISADTGYVTGDNGNIFYTDNGGVTWTNQTVNANGVLSVFYVNSDTIFACGAFGNILRYTSPCTPDAPASIIGNISVCTGSTETFSISPVQNATSYTWQVPTGASILSGQGDTLITVQFGSASGSIIVTASNICGQGPPTSVAITVKISPPVPVISQVAGILHSTSLVGNQWYYNGVAITGAINDTYLPLQNGTYTLVVTYTNGCSATSATFTVVNAGIDENNNILAGLTIAPNPVEQIATIQFYLMKPAPVHVSVYDVIGNKVSEVTQSEMQQSINAISVNCKHFSKGIYVLKLEVNNSFYYKRFVKQ
ncbi:MAG: T9SS type A sorting domain-containing protein [Bacteroidia bacterium]